MYLSIRRWLRSLSFYHYKTIGITTLLPVIVTPILAHFGPAPLVLQVIVYAFVFFLWSASAVLAVAYMLTRDKSEAEQLVSQNVDALLEQISRLSEEQKDLRLDIRQQVDDLEEVVRSTFEQLGVVLPPRPISVRAKGAFFSFDVPAANGTVVGGSRVARLRRWFRRITSRLWGVVYGKPERS